MALKRKLIIYSILIVVFAGLFIRYSGRAPKRHYSDFRVYYATAQRFAEKDDIYARPDESITPFKYSPMFALLVSPLAKFSQKTASLIFFTINFLSLLLIFVISEKLICKSKLSFKQQVFLHGATILCSLRFILHSMDSGQVGIVIVALIVTGLYFLDKHKEKAAAFFIGLSVMFKYTPGIFLPYFAFRKRIKLVALIMIFIIIFCLVPALFVGIDKETEYVKSWLPFISNTSFDDVSLYDYKNHSLFALALRFFTKETPYNVSVANISFDHAMILTLILGMILYLFIAIPKKKDDFEKSIDYSSLFILMLLLNPNAWMHNFVALIFVYMTIFYYLIKVNFKDKLSLSLVSVSFVLNTLSSELFVGDRVEKVFEERSFLAIGTLVLLFVLLKLKWKQKGAKI